MYVQSNKNSKDIMDYLQIYTEYVMEKLFKVVRKEPSCTGTEQGRLHTCNFTCIML